MKIYKTSQRKMADLSDLEKYVSKDSTYSIHFSDLPRLGINPNPSKTGEFDTPIAVCGYPLTPTIYEKLKNNTIPFAQNRKYMHLYRIKDATIANRYTVGRYFKDLKKILELVEKNEEMKREIGYIEKTKKRPSADAEMQRLTANLDKLKAFGHSDRDPKPFSIMWFLGSKLTNNNRGWNAILRYLGHNAVIDYGTGILHPNEPEQTMVFNPSSIEYVKYYISPIYHRTIQDQRKFVKELDKFSIDEFLKLSEQEKIKKIEYIFQEVDNILPNEKLLKKDLVSLTDFYKEVGAKEKVQKVLKTICLNEKNEYIIEEALEKINDKEFVEKINKKLYGGIGESVTFRRSLLDDDSDMPPEHRTVKPEAVSNAEILMHGTFEQKQKLIEKIKNQEILRKIVLEEEDDLLRHAATKNITDQNLLTILLIGGEGRARDSWVGVRQAAAENITDIDVLKKAEKTDPNMGVKNIASSRIRFLSMTEEEIQEKLKEPFNFMFQKIEKDKKATDKYNNIKISELNKNVNLFYKKVIGNCS